MDYSKFTTTFLIFVAFISCCPKDDDFHHYKITFYNNSDNDIYVNAEWCYPDTVYRLSHKSLLSNPEDSRVAAHGINYSAFFCPWGTIEREFEENGEIMTVFVFDADIVENSTISGRIPVLQRINVTLDDLRKTNWTMVYPQ